MKEITKFRILKFLIHPIIYALALGFWIDPKIIFSINVLCFTWIAHFEVDEHISFLIRHGDDK